MAHVINDNCVMCGTCADVCPIGCISEGDGTCAAECPNDAISEG